MGISLHKDWAELLTLLFLLLGFVLAVTLQSALFAYVTALVAGFLAGRIFYIKRFAEPILPFVLIIVGFLVGFILGGFVVNRLLIFMLFLGAFALTYYLYLKKILVIFKSKRFIK